jgi:hypothetical protein
MDDSGVLLLRIDTNSSSDQEDKDSEVEYLNIYTPGSLLYKKFEQEKKSIRFKQ